MPGGPQPSARAPQPWGSLEPSCATAWGTQHGVRAPRQPGASLGREEEAEGAEGGAPSPRGSPAGFAAHAGAQPCPVAGWVPRWGQDSPVPHGTAWEVGRASVGDPTWHQTSLRRGRCCPFLSPLLRAGRPQGAAVGAAGQPHRQGSFASPNSVRPLGRGGRNRDFTAGAGGGGERGGPD